MTLPLSIIRLIPREPDWRYNLWLHSVGAARVSPSYERLVSAGRELWPSNEEFYRNFDLNEVANHSFDQDPDFAKCEAAFRDQMVRLKIDRLIYYGALSVEIANVVDNSGVRGFEAPHVELYKKYFCDTEYISRDAIMAGEMALAPFGGAEAIERMPIHLRKDMAVAMLGGQIKLTDADVIDALLPLTLLNAVSLSVGNRNDVNAWTKAVDQATKLLETRKKIGGSSGFRLDKDLVFEHDLDQGEPLSASDIDFDPDEDSGLIEKKEKKE